MSVVQGNMKWVPISYYMLHFCCHILCLLWVACVSGFCKVWKHFGVCGISIKSYCISIIFVSPSENLKSYEIIIMIISYLHMLHEYTMPLSHSLSSKACFCLRICGEWKCLSVCNRLNLNWYVYVSFDMTTSSNCVETDTCTEIFVCEFENLKSCEIIMMIVSCLHKAACIHINAVSVSTWLATRVWVCISYKYVALLSCFSPSVFCLNVSQNLSLHL